MKYRIAYKGDCTIETGKKIIAKLERLGGVNYYCLRGNADSYYHINKTDNSIECSFYLPETYTSIQLESTQKLFRLL